jgi:RNA polymerase sigma-70 factor (ECF subfamily)
VSTNLEQGAGDNTPSRVLGSLLYAPGDQPPVPESEWAEIVRAIGTGNEGALRELYERTNRIVFTLILRIVKDPLTAEEVMLDVYHDVWRRAADYDSARGSVVGWLMNQTRSRAIDRLRRERRQKRGSIEEGSAVLDFEVADEPPAADERRGRLHSALATLTAAERLAIETAYFHELTYAETAERLRAPVGTIKTRIRAALTKLRALLAGQEEP